MFGSFRLNLLNDLVNKLSDDLGADSSPRRFFLRVGWEVDSVSQAAFSGVVVSMLVEEGKESSFGG
jgi:hypothetical protein